MGRIEKIVGDTQNLIYARLLHLGARRAPGLVWIDFKKKNDLMETLNRMEDEDTSTLILKGQLNFDQLKNERPDIAPFVDAVKNLNTYYIPSTSCYSDPSGRVKELLSNGAIVIVFSHKEPPSLESLVDDKFSGCFKEWIEVDDYKVSLKSGLNPLIPDIPMSNSDDLANVNLLVENHEEENGIIKPIFYCSFNGFDSIKGYMDQHPKEKFIKLPYTYSVLVFDKDVGNSSFQAGMVVESNYKLEDNGLKNACHKFLFDNKNVGHLVSERIGLFVDRILIPDNYPLTEDQMATMLYQAMVLKVDGAGIN